jgi:hypothetical protein
MIWKRSLALAAILGLLSVPIDALSQNSPFPLQQTATLQNAAAATGNGSIFGTGLVTVVAFQVTGTFSATVAFEGTNDGTTFVALTCFTLDGQTSVTGASTTGIWRCNAVGLAGVRARISAFSSGTVTVTANGTSASNAIRDSLTPSGAISGQLRGTQTTAPTCQPGNANNPPTAVTVSGMCQVTGTDSFVRGLIGTVGAGIDGASGNTGQLIIAFNAAYAAAPTCVATYDSNAGYGYYIYAVTPTTATATLKLGGVHGTRTFAAFSPGDAFNLICAGTQ